MTGQDTVTGLEQAAMDQGDAPIGSLDEDRLGRRPFAEALAAEIMAAPGGPWLCDGPDRAMGERQDVDAQHDRRRPRRRGGRGAVQPLDVLRDRGAGQLVLRRRSASNSTSEDVEAQGHRRQARYLWPPVVTARLPSGSGHRSQRRRRHPPDAVGRRRRSSSSARNCGRSSRASTSA